MIFYKDLVMNKMLMLFKLDILYESFKNKK